MYYTIQSECASRRRYIHTYDTAATTHAYDTASTTSPHATEPPSTAKQEDTHTHNAILNPKPKS
jgi:hypothetical protein